MYIYDILRFIVFFDFDKIKETWIKTQYVVVSKNLGHYMLILEGRYGNVEITKCLIEFL